MVDINWTVIPQIINFLVLIFALNIVCYKPIRKILLERKAKVDGLTVNIESATQESEEKDKAFGAGVRQARAKGQKEKEALMLAAAEEEKVIVGKIMDKARDDMAAVKAQIAKETGEVKAALEKEVDAFADAITQKILGRAA
ncbi:MAG: ATP synthase F0 subunit B [Desulfobacteraceae bacterium]|jgi:F-type H+-transporting ATPase subunit b